MFADCVVQDGNLVDGDAGVADSGPARRDGEQTARMDRHLSAWAVRQRETREGIVQGGKTVVLLATLDTKGEETRFVKELIEARGLRALVVDTGVRGEPFFAADVSRAEVAQAAGESVVAPGTLGSPAVRQGLTGEG